MAKEVIYFEEDYVENFKCSWTTENKKFKDLSGSKLGGWEIIKMHKRVSPHNFWFCRCICGRIQSLSKASLIKKSHCTYCSSLLPNKVRVSTEDRMREINKIHPHLKFVSRGSKKWRFLCTLCNTEVRETSSALVDPTYKGVSCRCDNGRLFVQWTTELREKQILKICDERGINFLGWASKDKYTSSGKSRIILSCRNTSHEQWTSNIANFINSKNYGCPTCADETRGDRYRHDKSLIREKGAVVHKGKYNYDNFNYICSRTPSEIFCKKCKTTFNQSFDNHINKKRGCPSCAPAGYSPARYGYFYIQSLSGKYIKYGICNTKPQYRMKNQEKRSVFDHTILNFWGFCDGSTPRKMENLIKKTIPSGVCSREEMPDGFTETCKIEYYDNIINILQNKGYIK